MPPLIQVLCLDTIAPSKLSALLMKGIFQQLSTIFPWQILIDSHARISLRFVNFDNYCYYYASQVCYIIIMARREDIRIINCNKCSPSFISRINKVCKPYCIIISIIIKEIFRIYHNLEIDEAALTIRWISDFLFLFIIWFR